MSVRHSAGMAAVHQKAGAQVKEVIKMYLQYSKESIFRYTKRKFSAKRSEDHRRLSKGRPPKVSVRDHRQILSLLTKLPNTEEVFTSGSKTIHACVSERFSLRIL